MPTLPSPSQSNTLTALRSFLLNVLPGGVPVILGQVNRVPEPANTDFVVMTPIRRDRLETNVDDYLDASFTGSISGTTLTVTSVAYGTIAVGQTVYNLATGALGQITALGTGSGGTGTYTLGTGLTLASGPLWAGAGVITQPTRLTVQLDVHGPASADNAQTISTMFRDSYATEFFAGQNASVAPLYADDPKQIPFINAESQYEDRWVVDAVLQVNQSISVPQQFADQLDVDLNEVEAEFPIPA